MGIGNDANKATEQLPLDKVVEEMNQGIVFFTRGATTGKIAIVHKYYCSKCQAYHLRSAPDAVWDNNLDSLRYCHWQ